MVGVVLFCTTALMAGTENPPVTVAETQPAPVQQAVPAEGYALQEVDYTTPEANPDIATLSDEALTPIALLPEFAGGSSSSGSRAACSLANMQGSWASGFLSWTTQHILKVWFDPDDCATPGYPFLIQSINLTWADASAFGLPGEGLGTLTYIIDVECPLVHGDMCSGPGLEVWSSAVQTLVANDSGIYQLNIPINVCVNGPFFISIHWISWSGTAGRVPSPLWDSVARPLCHQWVSANNGVTWYDFTDYFVDGETGWVDITVNGNTNDACTDGFCEEEEPAVCGNGVVESGEECDPPDPLGLCPDVECYPPLHPEECTCMPYGACCIGPDCVATTLEADCAGDWYEGETCPIFPCEAPDCQLMVYDSGIADGVNGVRPSAGWTQAGVIDDFFVPDVDGTAWKCVHVEVIIDAGAAYDPMQVKIYALPGVPPSIYNLGNYSAEVPICDTTYSTASSTLTLTDSGIDMFGRDLYYMDGWGPECDPGEGVFGFHLTFPGTAAFGYWGSSARHYGERAAIWGDAVQLPSDTADDSFLSMAFNLMQEYEPSWGACCDDATGICNDNVELIDCPAPLRFAENTLCVDLDPLCGEILGACCYDTPQTPLCAETFPPDCIGGTWMGAGTVCDPNPCPMDCPPNLYSAQDSLYSQPLEVPFVAPASIVSDEHFPNLVADKFVGMVSDIRDVHWWGINGDRSSGSWVACVKDPDTYTITFYTDAGATPGGIWCQYSAVTPTKVATGHVYSGYPVYYYSFDLPSPCALRQGWVSIQGLDNGGECQFMWLRSDVGDGFISVCDNSGVWRSEDRDVAFCLTGDPSLVVMGACCEESSAYCFDTAMSACNYDRFEAGMTCATLVPPCGSALGACCYDDGTCVPDMTNDDCLASGGAWLGWNSACEPCNPCPQPPPECPPNSIFARPIGALGWATVSDEGWPNEVADHYTCDPEVPIGDIHWWGFYAVPWAPCAKTADTFIIRFYEDDGTGQPAETAYATYDNVSATKVLTGDEWDSGEGPCPMYFYSALIEPACDLMDGWCSIEGKAEEGCMLIWHESGAGDWLVFSRTGTAWGILSDAGVPKFPGMSFCLTPAPAGACCDDSTGICNDDVAGEDCQLPLRFAANTLCADLIPACGNGACCFFDPDSCTEDMTEADCVAAGGTFAGGGSTCGAMIACCYGDGSVCENLHETCCPLDGGWPGYAPACLGDGNGDGIDDACQLLGACCHDQGVCTLTEEEDCDCRFMGYGVLCDPNPCLYYDPCCDACYLNGYYDNANGLSAERRTDGSLDRWIVDDVVLTEEIVITDVHWWTIDEAQFNWNGFDDLIVLNDGGGMPVDPAIVTMLDIPNTRIDTGEVMFGLPVYLYTIILDPADAITIGPGTFWFGVRPVQVPLDPTGQSYWATAPLTGSEVWVKYPDQNPANIWEPGSTYWPDAYYNVAFCLTCGIGCPNNTQFIPDPPQCTIDTRRPSRADAQTPCYGIGMPDDTHPNALPGVNDWDPFYIDLGPTATGAACECFVVTEDPDCDADPDLQSICGTNYVVTCPEVSPGVYELTLEHGIAHCYDVTNNRGQSVVTTITYTGTPGGSVSYIKLPGNVNLDLVTNAADITALIGCLNAPGTCTNYQADEDHSGLIAGADITELIQFLNGAQAYDVWLLAPKPTCPPGP
jgi:hypothetical protein